MIIGWHCTGLKDVAVQNVLPAVMVGLSIVIVVQPLSADIIDQLYDRPALSAADGLDFQMEICHKCSLPSLLVSS